MLRARIVTVFCQPAARVMLAAALTLVACDKPSDPRADGGVANLGCAYAGHHHVLGEVFKSADGCNDCSCGSGASVVCTQRACDQDASAAPALSLHWYQTCGAPNCGPSGNVPTGQPQCTTERLGAVCVGEGAQCDPGLGCNVNFICAASDPRLSTACPH